MLANVSNGWSTVAEAYPVPVENLLENFRNYWAERPIGDGLGALEKTLSSEATKVRITQDGFW
jgi:hypothetical protein